ncbi:MAG TPA: hypothetical protein VMB66_00130 [Candidatus Acidoferrales bacterium]|nr:hypothetical protein [Candidatus Acidoferrales bacterium]
MPRLRHCVECPLCSTRYLIAFSPYGNGSYLMPAVHGCSDEYILYCSCRRGSCGTRWKSTEVKTCDVSREAYERGYGTADEILPVDERRQENQAFDIGRYLENWRSMERGKNSI